MLEVASTFERLLGRRWQHYKIEHVTHFDPNTVARLLDGAGFELVELGTRGAGKYVSADFVVERSGRVLAALPKLLAPLRARVRGGFCVNPLDEMLVVGRKR